MTDTGQRQAVGAQGKVGRGIRGVGTDGREGCGSRRHVAGGIGLLDAQLLAFELRGAQVDGKGAVGRDDRRAQHGAIGVTDGDGGAGLASPAQAQAIACHRNVGRGRRRGHVGGHHLARHRCVAGTVGLFYRQGLPVQLGAVEGKGEGAIGIHHGAAEQGARGIANVDGSPGFAGTGQRHAIGRQLQVVERIRRGHVGSGVGRRGRGRTGGVGLHGREGFAVELCRGQGDGEGAIGADHGGAQDRTVGAAHRDDVARLADAAQGQAVGAEGQVRGGVRGIGTDRRRGRDHGRCIAGGIGLFDAQLLTVELGRAQCHGEGAVGCDHSRAQDDAIGIAHGDGGAWLTTAAQAQAIVGHLYVGRGVRGGDVGGGVGRGGGGEAGRISLHGREGFAVELGGRQGKGEGAVGTYHGRAQHAAVGRPDRDRVARLSGPAQGQAIGAQRQIGGCRRRVHAGRCGRHGADGGVAGRIGLGDGQGLTVELGAAEGDREAAIGRDHGGAQHAAVRATYGDRGTWLAGTGQRQAIVTDLQAGGRGRRGHVGGDEGGSGRGEAFGIGLDHAQGFAIELRAAQGHAEGAVSRHHCGAQHGAIGAADGHRVAGFAPAGEGQPVGAQRQGCRCRRCIHPRWGKGRGGRRDVAGGIRLLDAQGLAIGLGSAQGHAEGAIGTDHGRAEHRAVGTAHGDRGAWLAGTTERQTVGADGQVGRRGGWGHVGGDQRCVGGGIARRVGLIDRQGLAIELRCTQADAERPVGGHHGRAQHATIGAPYSDGGTRLAGPGEGQAVGAQLQVGGRGRRLGVGGGDDDRVGGGARRVGLVDDHRLTVVLRRVERHGEVAIGADHRAAQQGAVRAAHVHRSARDAGPGQ